MSTIDKTTWYHPENLLDKFFAAGIILKGLDGLIELIAGFVLLFLTPDRMHDFIVLVTHQELSEDPHDFLANLLLQSSQGFTTGGRVFLIVYLWIHAVIKLVAVFGILRNKMWAYPFSLITLGVLTLYQFYEIVFVKISLLMVILTVFDVLILGLIWREYSNMRKSNDETPKQ